VFKKPLEVKKPMEMERSNSSLIPPLMEVSSASSGNRALATESQLAHVTCFSSVPKTEHLHEELFAAEYLANSSFLPHSPQLHPQIDPSFVELLCPGASFTQLLGNSNNRLKQRLEPERGVVAMASAANPDFSSVLSWACSH
jgi:hypothetical protein